MMAHPASRQKSTQRRELDRRKTSANIVRACSFVRLDQPPDEIRHFRAVELAVLIFDSAVSPRTSGTRFGTPFPRRLLFRCGDLHVDVELEPTGLKEEMRITGQVMDLSVSAIQLVGVRVSALSGSEQLAETQTNESGEFILVIQKSKSPWLLVQLNEHRIVRVNLDGNAERSARG